MAGSARDERIQIVHKRRSRPISRVLSWAIIPLGRLSPDALSDLPGNGAGRAIVSLFGLAPGGVCPATAITNSAVRSYRTFSPLPLTGGMFPVALSIGSRRPDAIWRLALWSPDFPPPAHTGSDCLADSIDQFIA